jgi:CDP-diacylglycerol--glycerol-3-phosphate 3-phosphatidyltransferase
VSPTLLAIALVFGAALLSMPVFALVHRGRRDADAVGKGSRFLLGVGDFLVHWFLWAITPAERALLRAGAGPDHLNALGLLFGLASGVAIALSHLEAGGAAIAIAGVCDILDGRLARARQVVSPYGKFIDSTLDRFVETAAFLGFAVYFAGRPWGPLVVAAGLGGSLLVSYAQARGETVGVSGSGGLMQRAERLVLQILGCLFDPALCRWLSLPEGTVLFGFRG